MVDQQSQFGSVASNMSHSSDLLNTYDNFTDLNTETSFDMSNFDFSSICGVELDKLGHCIVFFIFTLFGLIGNISLLFVIISSRNLHSAPNILIVNLAIGDLLYMVSTAPFNIRHELIACWLLGSTACKVKHYLPIVAQAACIFSLVALSKERHNAIVKGLETKVKDRFVDQPMFSVFLSWVSGLVIGSPVFVLSKTTTFGLLCVYMPMKNMFAEVYVVLLFLILYVIPFTIISLHYTRLAMKLCQSDIVTLMGNRSSLIQQLRTRRRLALIVLTITVLFGLFWLPYHVYHLWYMFTKYHKHIMANKKHIEIFRHFYNYMSLANSCFNPWIVFIMSSAHRQSVSVCLYGSHCSTKRMARRVASWRRATTTSTMTSWKEDHSQNPVVSVRSTTETNNREHTL